MKEKEMLYPIQKIEWCEELCKIEDSPLSEIAKEVEKSYQESLDAIVKIKKLITDNRLDSCLYGIHFEAEKVAMSSVCRKIYPLALGIIVNESELFYHTADYIASLIKGYRSELRYGALKSYEKTVFLSKSIWFTTSRGTDNFQKILHHCGIKHELNGRRFSFNYKEDFENALDFIRVCLLEPTPCDKDMLHIKFDINDINLGLRKPNV